MPHARHSAKYVDDRRSSRVCTRILARYAGRQPQAISTLAFCRYRSSPASIPCRYTARCRTTLRAQPKDRIQASITSYIPVSSWQKPMAAEKPSSPCLVDDGEQNADLYECRPRPVTGMRLLRRFGRNRLQHVGFVTDARLYTSTSSPERMRVTTTVISDIWNVLGPSWVTRTDDRSNLDTDRGSSMGTLS